MAPTSTAQTRDVSANGVFLYTKSRMEKGTDVELVLILPPELTSGEKCWVCCQATIVRVEEEGSSSGWRPRSGAWTSCPKPRSELAAEASMPFQESLPGRDFPKITLALRQVQRDSGDYISVSLVKKSFPLHRSRCNNGGPRIALANFRFQVGPVMLIEKLAAGVVQVQTPIGPRYVMPSFLQRVYLLWMFRNFPILPHAVLNRTAATHDRPNVQRAAFRLDGLRRSAWTKRR